MDRSRNATFNATPDEAFARQLELARSGSAEALGALLQGCRRYLLLAASRALESTLRPKEGASDLVQETFVLAQRDFQSFRGTTLGELLAWLHRILERQLFNKLRHYKQTAKRNADREVPLDVGDNGAALGLTDGRPSPADRAADREEERHVWLAIEQLPEDYQRVLELRTWQRLPFAEIGHQMDRSAGAAEKLWLRAVERLQSVLRDVR